MKNPFATEKHTFHVVEVPTGTKLPEITGDLRESLKTLQFNPAFSYIIQRLRVQRAGVQNALQEGLQLTETQIRFLQAGLYWLSYLEKDINVLTQASANNPRPSFDNEAEQFAKIRQSLDFVGA